MIRLIVTPRGKSNLIAEIVQLITLEKIKSYKITYYDSPTNPKEATLEGKVGQFAGENVRLKYDSQLNLAFAIIENDQDMLLGSFVSRLYARLGDKIRSIHVDFTRAPSWLDGGGGVAG